MRGDELFESGIEADRNELRVDEARSSEASSAIDVCTPIEIDRALRSLARRRAALDVEEARWLRLGERQNAWSKLGYVHVLEYLEHVFGYGPRTAVEKLRVANELGTLPELERALEAGEVNYSVVRELTRVATPETVGRWLGAAHGKNLRDVERMVSGHRKGDDPDDAPDPKLAKFGVWLELDAESFALYRQARAMLDDEADAKLSDKEFIAAMAGALLAGGGTAPGREAARPARMNHITTCRDCCRGWQDGAGVRAELDAAAVERAHCDAIIVDDELDKRARSAIPLKTRRKVLERDRHRCQVPGCNSQRNLEVHEIRKRAHGGAPDPIDLTSLCARHHKLPHEGRLLISGQAPNALEFEEVEPLDASVRNRPPVRAPSGDQCTMRAQLPAAAVAHLQSNAPIDANNEADDAARMTPQSSRIPPKTRRMVMERAQYRCQVPGCRSAHHLDAHHRKHRAHGGTHHPDNLIVLCSGHHRLYHLGLLLITGDPDALQFERVSERGITKETQHAQGTQDTPNTTAHRRPNALTMQDIADAQTALRQMGYKPAIAKRAVDRACAHVGANADLIALIKEALKRCN